MALLVVIGGCSDRFEKTYATLRDANLDRAIERGWVPANLPASSSEIRELHNVDTNEVWGTFSLSQIDQKTFESTVAPATADEMKCIRPGPAWSHPLRSQTSVDHIEYYKLADYRSTTYFGVDWKRGIAFFWKCAR